jgi:hypothetical protein
MTGFRDTIEAALMWIKEAEPVPNRMGAHARWSAAREGLERLLDPWRPISELGEFEREGSHVVIDRVVASRLTVHWSGHSWLGGGTNADTEYLVRLCPTARFFPLPEVD